MTLVRKPEIGGCRNCGTPWPLDALDKLFELGWGDAGTLCPTCRSDRNARAAATAGRIASGLADMYAASWGTGSRKVEIRELPSMVVRSATVVGPDTSPDDMRGIWAELGDGAYLVTMTLADSFYLVVQVDGGNVDIEPIIADQAALMPALAASLEEPDDAVRA